MDEKKLVPKRRFEEFKLDWKQKRFGDYFNIISGYAFKKSDYSFTGIPIINGESIQNGKIKTDNLNYLPAKFYEGYNNFRVSTGDIVIGLNRPIINSKLKISLIPKHLNDSMLYQRAGKIIKLNEMHTYFAYQMLEKEILEFVKKESVGSDQPFISTTGLMGFYLQLPGNNREQQKIGEFFKVLDERIANQERKIAKVKALKAAYLTEMFPQEGETVPKRRFKGFEGEWNETILDSVLAYEQPTDYIVDEDSYDDSYDIPVLTAGQSFLLGYTNEKHGIKKADVNNSVIIFDDFTTSSRHVDFFFKVKSSALKILSSNSRKYSTYFAYLILKNIDYTLESHERHWISIFSNFEVMTPSMEEQQKIGEFFKNLDNQIRLEEKKLDKLQKMKKAYLEEMFV